VQLEPFPAFDNQGERRLPRHGSGIRGIERPNRQRLGDHKRFRGSSHDRFR
jgi:hypothetical protein